VLSVGRREKIEYAGAPRAGSASGVIPLPMFYSAISRALIEKLPDPSIICSGTSFMGLKK